MTVQGNHLVKKVFNILQPLKAAVAAGRFRGVAPVVLASAVIVRADWAKAVDLNLFNNMLTTYVENSDDAATLNAITGRSVSVAMCSGAAGGRYSESNGRLHCPEGCRGRRLIDIVRIEDDFAFNAFIDATGADGIILGRPGLHPDEEQAELESLLKHL